MCRKLNKGDLDGVLTEAIFRLRHLVEDSDLSFYQIASLLGTSGTILSMWLSGTARPDRSELGEIEKLLEAWTVVDVKRSGVEFVTTTPGEAVIERCRDNLKPLTAF
jgi:transcriptional regulator with XRE-family HTH domain